MCEISQDEIKGALGLNYFIFVEGGVRLHYLQCLQGGGIDHGICGSPKFSIGSKRKSG